MIFCGLTGMSSPLSPSLLFLSLRAELTSDKGGIEITSDPGMTNGKVTFSVERLQEMFVVKFYISNNGASCVYFTYYTALHRIRCFTLMDKRRVTRACPLFLCPGEKKTSTICLNALLKLSEYIWFC